MRATLLAVIVAFVCAATGCANLNLARRGGCDAPACAEPVACASPVPCAKPVGCAQPIGCAAAVSPAGPAGVSPYAPPAPAVSPYVPAAAPYDPGYGGYDPRLRRHQRIPYGNPGAVVAYPYYTIRGPRDFLLDNPPSIGR